MPCGLASLEEIFRTTHGVVFQCSNKNCYWLDFGGDCTPFKVNDFIQLKKQVEQIDIDAMLLDPRPGAEIAIIMPFRSHRCFVLQVEDVINLRELLRGAKFMMELPGLIKDCLKISPALYA